MIQLISSALTYIRVYNGKRFCTLLNMMEETDGGNVNSALMLQRSLFKAKSETLACMRKVARSCNFCLKINIQNMAIIKPNPTYEKFLHGTVPPRGYGAVQ